MHLIKKIVLFLFFIVGVFAYAQSERVTQLENKVKQFNTDFEYEKSLELIVNFINDKNTTYYEKAYAYILKSYNYKRFFNYDETLKCLDMALKESEKSDMRTEIEIWVMAEKSFVYFDTQQYDKAEKLMQELKQLKYTSLSISTVAFLMMQEGLLFMFDRDYFNAEKKFEEATTLLEKSDSKNLPIIYGKKVELYNKMGLTDKRDEAFLLGYKSAEENNLLKYRIYMNEVLKGQYEYNKDYKNAFLTDKIVDSLSKIYDAEQQSIKLSLYEKRMDFQKKEYELETNRKTRYFLTILSVVLLILFIISVKFNRINKQKKDLIENEYNRIYKDLQLLTEKMNGEESIEVKLSKYNLSERHLVIINLIQQGKINKEIAFELCISENTVKYHLKTIYEILEIDNRNELFRLLNS